MIIIKKALVDNIANIKKDVKEMVKAIVQIKWMRTQLFQAPELRIDQGRILGKNYLKDDGLVKPMYKFAKSVFETSSKV